MPSIFSTELGGQTYVASVGSLGGREAAQMAEAMVESDFSDSEGAESVGFSQGELGLVGAVRISGVLALEFKR